MSPRHRVLGPTALAVLALVTSSTAALACPPSLTVEAASSGVAASGAFLVLHALHGCHPGTLAVSGEAEGLIAGARRSIRLELSPAPAAGDFLVRRQWPADGVWVLRLTVTEGGGHATVLVGIGPSGTISSVRQPPRTGTARDPSDADIAAILRSLAAG